MKKILTKEGIKEVDEVYDVNNDSKEDKKEKVIPEAPKIKEEIKKFNENPVTKQYGIVAMKKTTYVGIWIFAVVCILLFAINMIWYNSILSSKEFTNNINVDTPDVNMTNIEANNVFNNFTINNTIIFPNNITIKCINQTNG